MSKYNETFEEDTALIPLKSLLWKLPEKINVESVYGVGNLN